jgi:hypothetical protein
MKVVTSLRGGKRKKKNGEPGGTRTRDHRIKSAMLYQLSYRPVLRLRASPASSAVIHPSRSEFHCSARIRERASRLVVMQKLSDH